MFTGLHSSWAGPAQGAAGARSANGRLQRRIGALVYLYTVCPAFSSVRSILPPSVTSFGHQVMWGTFTVRVLPRSLPPSVRSTFSPFSHVSETTPCGYLRALFLRGCGAFQISAAVRLRIFKQLWHAVSFSASFFFPWCCSSDPRWKQGAMDHFSRSNVSCCSGAPAISLPPPAAAQR